MLVLIIITINENYDENDDDDDGNGSDNLVSHLVLIGLEQDAHPVRVVVHGEVCEPGAGVRVDHDLVPADAVDHDALAGHRVLVVAGHLQWEEISYGDHGVLQCQ